MHIERLVAINAKIKPMYNNTFYIVHDDKIIYVASDSNANASTYYWDNNYWRNGRLEIFQLDY